MPAGKTGWERAAQSGTSTWIEYKMNEGCTP